MTGDGNGARLARRDMGDDIVMPFTVDALDVRGRIVRLGEAVDAAIRQHAYPPPVSRLLAEMMALAALLGTALKFDGKLILQAQGDGPVNMLVADFTTPGFIRGLARFDEKAVDELPRDRLRDAAALLGKGQLVFTIDQGPDMQRYQGVVALGGSLAQAARDYFERSEQIPTRLKLAAGQITTGKGESWRAGAMMIQHLPPAGAGREDRGRDADDDKWRRAEALFDTLEDHELLDPELSPERLAFRLYHEDGVRVFEPTSVVWRCGCRREKLLETIRNFSPEERRAMVENGKITATCQFCSRQYAFTPQEVGLEDEG